jgi:hypothetical protein
MSRSHKSLTYSKLLLLYLLFSFVLQSFQKSIRPIVILSLIMSYVACCCWSIEPVNHIFVVIDIVYNVSVFYCFLNNCWCLLFIIINLSIIQLSIIIHIFDVKCLK